MPQYRQYIENFSSPASDIDVKVYYDVDKGNVETGIYPVSETPVVTYTTGDIFENPILRGKPETTFRQQEKLPNEFKIRKCTSVETNAKFDVKNYSNKIDRLVYIGQDIKTSLNNGYTGCCFKPGENEGDPPVFYEEPSLDQKRVMDLKLAAIGYDQFGFVTWDNQRPYATQFGGAYACPVESPLIPAGTPEEYIPGPVVRSETFTLEFLGITPQIRDEQPYLDDDLTVKLVKNDAAGNELDEIVATSSTIGSISMTATYPETITIRIRGEYSKKLFPNETWQYYFIKKDENGNDVPFTPVPGHLAVEFPIETTRPYDAENSIEDLIDEDDDSTITLTEFNDNTATSLDVKTLPFDPNERYALYQVDQQNKNGVGIVRDLSQEIPSNGIVYKYFQDTTTQTTVKFNFNVTSSIPPITIVTWALGATITAGDYVSFGGELWIALTSGVVFEGTPPTPGDPNAEPPVPGDPGEPADVGPTLQEDLSGLFFTDNGGLRYRYVPSNIVNRTSYGEGEWSTTMYVLNDATIGLERFTELVEAQQI